MSGASPDRPSYPLPARAVIGVIHLPPLPGSPQHAGGVESIVDRAAEEAVLLTEHGFSAVIVENFGDAPFAAGPVGPHVVAMMSRVLAAVRAGIALPVGCNVLRNDAAAALAVATATGARFIRVNVHTGVYATDQGTIEGHAADTLRYRQALRCDVAIFADVHVKHATPVSQPDLALAAEETAYRGLADALIVTGPTTGRPTEFDQVRTVRSAVPDRPILIGSGVTAKTLREALSVADGVIVGSALRRDGRPGAPLDAGRLDAFTRAIPARHAQ